MPRRAWRRSRLKIFMAASTLATIFAETALGRVNIGDDFTKREGVSTEGAVASHFGWRRYAICTGSRSPGSVLPASSAGSCWEPTRSSPGAAPDNAMMGKASTGFSGGYDDPVLPRLRGEGGDGMEDRGRL